MYKGEDVVSSSILNKSIGERLKKFREHLQLKQGDIAKRININQGYYSKIENGQNTISINIIIKLKNEYGLNPNWLLTGEGEMLIDKFILGDRKEHINLSEFVGIPFTKDYVNNNRDKIQILFKKEWLSRFVESDKCSVFEIESDTMEPTFRSGDLVLVDHSKFELNDSGGIYAFEIKRNGTVSVRRLVYDFTTGEISVISDNTAYPVLKDRIGEVVILGRVISHLRKI